MKICYIQYKTLDCAIKRSILVLLFRIEIRRSYRGNFKNCFIGIIYNRQFSNYYSYSFPGGQVSRTWHYRGVADTYWGKNKGRSKEGRLVKATIVCVVLFFIISIVLNMGIW